MKKILALGGLFLALNGYTQSYLVLSNGVTITTDKAAFVYDFGHFILPYKITLTGGRFFAEEGKLVSIDEQGYLYRKDEKAPAKIKGKGASYIIAENGTLLAFDAKGFLYKYDKEPALKKANNYGGNFFTVKPEDRKPETQLYTVNSLGNFFKMDVPGLNAADISIFGGTFFQTNLGAIFTVNKDGFVFSKPDLKTGLIRKIGGNFFIDSNNGLYTIAEDGMIQLPALPANLKIESITKIGQNYFLDREGKLYVVDSTGAVFQRDVKDHNLKDAKVFSI